MAGWRSRATLAGQSERRRALLGGVAICVAILAFAGGCSVTGQKAPTGLLGLKWGDDATAAARQLGLTIARWEPWIDPAFETALDLDHPRAVLGTEGLVRLVRAGGNQLDGVQVIYRACARDDARKRQLREGLGRDLHVKSPDVDVPYEVWADGSLVHFVGDPRDDTCTLTVAGPRFGNAFKAALLAGALGNLGGAMVPR
jgi:hypothetical protein